MTTNRILSPYLRYQEFERLTLENDTERKILHQYSSLERSVPDLISLIDHKNPFPSLSEGVEKLNFSKISLSKSNHSLERNQDSYNKISHHVVGKTELPLLKEHWEYLNGEARPCLVDGISALPSDRRYSTVIGSLGNNLGNNRGNSAGSLNSSESEIDYPDNEYHSSTGNMAVLSDSERDVEESMDSIRYEEDDDSSKSGNQILENSYRNAFQINKFLELSNLQRLSDRTTTGETASSLSANGTLIPPSLSLVGAAAMLPQSLLAPSLMPGYPLAAIPSFPEAQAGSPSSTDLLARAFVASRGPRKPRGEKKPIPNDLKDSRYFERRKRNNAAAKKSRDARKQREDEIAKKASILQSENERLKQELRIATFNLQSMILHAIRKRLPVFSMLNGTGPHSEFMNQLIQQTKALFEASNEDFD